MLILGIIADDSGGDIEDGDTGAVGHDNYNKSFGHNLWPFYVLMIQYSDKMLKMLELMMENFNAHISDAGVNVNFDMVQVLSLEEILAEGVPAQVSNDQKHKRGHQCDHHHHDHHHPC